MKRIIIALLIVLTVYLTQSELVFPSAPPLEIPGGVVYCEDGKVVYQKFQSEKKINLLPKAEESIYPPVAVSEDGRLLIWIKEDKFWKKKMPEGKPRPVYTEEDINYYQERTYLFGSFKALTNLRALNIENLSVSSKKHYLAFETQSAGSFWIAVIPTTRKLKASKYHEINLLPCIFNPKTTKELLQPSGPSLPTNKKEFRIAGNSEDKMEAHFPAWSKQAETIALVVKGGPEWGPVIFQNQSIFGKGKIDGYSLLSAKDIQGLAWRPDGKLTVHLVNGKLFSVEGSLITTGVKGTGLTWLTNTGFIIRDPNGILHLIKLGRSPITLLNHVPKGFSYCRQSPIFDNHIESRITVPPQTEFYIGPLCSSWLPSYNSQTILFYPGPHFQEIPLKGDIEFALIDTPFSKVTNPTGYKFQKLEKPFIELETTPTLAEQGETLALKINQRYFLIKTIQKKGKPVSFRWKYWYKK